MIAQACRFARGVLGALGLLFSSTVVATELHPRQDIEPLDYSVLKELSQSEKAQHQYARSIMELLNSSEVSNEAWKNGFRAHRPEHEKLGKSLGFVSWNVEQSLNVEDEIIPGLLDERVFVEKLRARGVKEKDIEAALEQRELIRSADIVILQEQERGITRSGYINSAREMARTLGMNYAFGPSQIEIDPKQFERGADPERYEGLFGSAVLSRYPIKAVRHKQLETQVYDWYAGEKARISWIEHLKRFGARVFLDEHKERELKVGGRSLLIVDLHVPGLEPNETLTVVNVHLEIKARPEDRAEQMREVLREIQHIENPVIMAGDFNTSQSDISPTNPGRMATRYAADPENFVDHAHRVADAASLLGDASGVIGALNRGRKLTNSMKNFHNPLAMHIPVLLPNERKELFDEIEEFKFADGACFDFRGDAGRALHGRERYVRKRIGPPGKGFTPTRRVRMDTTPKLGNSNERMETGRFETTFETNITYGGMGTDRLDFLFVKSGKIKDCKEQERYPYYFAPHFASTLQEYNRLPGEDLSDHDPIHAWLPLQEPVKLNEELMQKPERETLADKMAQWKAKRQEKKAAKAEASHAKTSTPANAQREEKPRLGKRIFGAIFSKQDPNRERRKPFGPRGKVP